MFLLISQRLRDSEGQVIPQTGAALISFLEGAIKDGGFCSLTAGRQCWAYSSWRCRTSNSYMVRNVLSDDGMLASNHRPVFADITFLPTIFWRVGSSVWYVFYFCTYGGLFQRVIESSRRKLDVRCLTLSNCLWIGDECYVRQQNEYTHISRQGRREGWTQFRGMGNKHERKWFE